MQFFLDKLIPHTYISPHKKPEATLPSEESILGRYGLRVLSLHSWNAVKQKGSRMASLNAGGSPDPPSYFVGENIMS